MFVIGGAGADGTLSHRRSACVCVALVMVGEAARPPIGRRGVGSEAHASIYGEEALQCALGRACV